MPAIRAITCENPDWLPSCSFCLASRQALFRLQASEEFREAGGPSGTRRDQGRRDARVEQHGDNLGQRHIQAQHRREQIPKIARR
jgi:hypothetical protein